MSYNNELETAVEYMNSGEAAKFKDVVYDVLARKVNNAIEARKELVAQTIFNSDEE